MKHLQVLDCESFSKVFEYWKVDSVRRSPCWFLNVSDEYFVGYFGHFPSRCEHSPVFWCWVLLFLTSSCLSAKEKQKLLIYTLLFKNCLSQKELTWKKITKTKVVGILIVSLVLNLTMKDISRSRNMFK